MIIISITFSQQTSLSFFLSFFEMSVSQLFSLPLANINLKSKSPLFKSAKAIHIWILHSFYSHQLATCRTAAPDAFFTKQQSQVWVSLFHSHIQDFHKVLYVTVYVLCIIDTQSNPVGNYKKGSLHTIKAELTQWERRAVFSQAAERHTIWGNTLIQVQQGVCSTNQNTTWYT